MDPAEFTRDSPGKLLLIPERVHAFVPNALPSELKLNSETVKILSEADRSLGHLHGVARLK